MKLLELHLLLIPRIQIKTEPNLNSNQRYRNNVLRVILVQFQFQRIDSENIYERGADFYIPGISNSLETNNEVYSSCSI